MIAFLKRLWRNWRVSIHSRPRGPISEAESIARFLTHERHFSATKGVVKAGGFMPPPDLATSVFRTAGLSEARVWGMGQAYVRGYEGRGPLARADLVALEIITVGLRLQPDDVPPRHAGIVGWPLEKEAQKDLALELAARATLQVAPHMKARKA